jgi:putative membrane protein
MKLAFGTGALALALALGVPLATNAATADRTDKASTNKASSLSSGEKKFVSKAAESSLMEIEMGKLAQKKTQSDDVKALAKRIVDDHTKANEQLKQIAQSKGVELPTAMDKSAHRDMEKMQKLSGAEFDREYVKNQVSHHKKDVKEFRDQAKSGKDSDIKSFASETLPKLEQHLQMAQAAEANVKGEKRAQSGKAEKRSEGR